MAPESFAEKALRTVGETLTSLVNAINALIRAGQPSATAPLPATRRAPVARTDVTKALLDMARDEWAGGYVDPSEGYGQANAEVATVDNANRYKSL
ncbi:MAG: hypothetical protein LBF58_07980, partial [Deltaproteobacteria bacterium]|nr:hypothetical protein [Deltaproteobacteria bacterium]